MPYVRASDLKIHYLEAGEGEPVVFVHGNWANAAWWEPALARLPAGYRGLAPDLRGRGQTEGPDSSYSLEALAGDLLAFTEAMGLARCHMVGHSLGAGIVLQAALDDPQRPLSLTLIAPPWPDGMPEELNQPERQQMLKDNPAIFGPTLKLIAGNVTEDAYWQRLVAEGHDQRIEAALANLDAMCAWRPGAALSSISAPRLVIGGALDPLVAGGVIERVASLLGVSPIILANIGHSVNIENPDLFMELLIPHLQGA